LAPPTSTITGTPASRIEQRAHHFGDGDQAGIGFVQPHAARFHQQHHGRHLRAALAQQADQLGAMHLADAPPMKAPSCAATYTGTPPSSARPMATPSSKATGAFSCARCGLVTRADGGRIPRSCRHRTAAASARAQSLPDS
jgi:hypothetical protein